MKRNFFGSVLLSLFVFFKLYSQSEPPKIIPTSPNTASLGRYGDYSVNLFTGLPDISIPIYEVKSGELSLPITLTYHASGIRYTDKASWVGLGWSLNTGGVVSRNIRGLPDEDEGFAVDTFLYNKDKPFLFKSLDVCRDFTTVNLIATGKKDMEQDIFSYSFGGNSGKFVLNRDNLLPTLIPLSAVRIDYEIENKRINRFDIYDEGGTKYVFGRKYPGEVYIEETEYKNVAWMLNEVSAPLTDDKISFQYQQGDTYNNNEFSESVMITDNVVNNYCGRQSDHESPENCIKHYPNPGSYRSIPNPALINQLIPQTILFENGKIEFIPERGEDNKFRLDQIKIYTLENGVYQIVSTYKFIYSYFKSIAVESLRLKLDNLYKLDKNDLVQEKYKFEYYTDTFSWDMPLGSLRKDYWGFYNGKANTSLIPRTKIDDYTGDSPTGYSTIYVGTELEDGKESNPTLMKQGVLKKITFPTGGFTEFDFEINKYKESNGDTALAGGLRIKQIKSYHDGLNLPLIKTYKYGKNEDGFGKRNFVKSLKGHYISVYNWRDAGMQEGAGSYRRRTVSSDPLFEKDPWDASIVIYPYVAEYFGNNDDNVGKIEYIYDEGTPKEDEVRPMATGLLYKESYHWQRGALTEKKVYDNQGNLLTKTKNTYTVLNKTFQNSGLKVHLAGACACMYSIYCAETQHEKENLNYVYGVYSLATGAYKITESKEFIYNSTDPSQFVLNYKKYKYNSSHWQTTELTESSSQPGEEIITRTQYPLDYGSADILTGSLKKLNDMNIKNKVIERYSFKQINGTNPEIISGLFTSFKENLNSDIKPTADTVFQFESGAIPLSSFTPSYLSSGIIKKDSRYKPRLKFVNFNAEGNIEEFAQMDDAIIENTRTSYIWGYNKSLPVAEVINATHNQIAYTSFETENLQGSSDENGGWTVYSPTYINNDSKTGRSCITNPSTTSGYHLKKSYLPLGSYTVSLWANGTGTIKVNGQSKTAIPGWNYYEWTVPSATEITVTNNGNKIDEVRLYPTKSRMTTYTYNPLLGISSITDPNNLISFYDYDPHGRLKAIKDLDANILKAYHYNYLVK
ncbi:MAG TPA: hypothetical protein VD908_07960 [Cytophagales bacterium]|nr:hypothetical protein [Cytophagales bacterium]